MGIIGVCLLVFGAVTCLVVAFTERHYIEAVNDPHHWLHDKALALVHAARGGANVLARTRSAKRTGGVLVLIGFALLFANIKALMFLPPLVLIVLGALLWFFWNAHERGWLDRVPQYVVTTTGLPEQSVAVIQEGMARCISAFPMAGLLCLVVASGAILLMLLW